MKKKEQNYKLKYAIIQKTLDDFRQLYITSLKDKHIDEKEYQRFVTHFEIYRVASHTASQAASRATANTNSQIQVTNKRDNMRENIRDTPKPNSFFHSF